MSLQVISFYRFSYLDPGSLVELRDRFTNLGLALEIKGTLLLASEGVNGSLWGPESALQTLLKALEQVPGLAPLQTQACLATAPAFRHFKVRIKQEIVSLGRADVLPQQGVGVYVPPAEWNQLVDDPDTLLIDTRNAYEVRVGHFPGAIHPNSTSFREFPAWTSSGLTPFLQDHPKRRLALFCTGGIRCEKATAFLLQQGFDQVYHLQGGILNYLRQIPAAASRWSGECFVFDQRVSLNHQLESGSHALCHGCRMPLSQADTKLPSYVEGVSCRYCLTLHSNSDRQRFAERQRQLLLARSRETKGCG
ncbi:MAG: rhodanese-related sulfurtransferase [Cyanobacteriota bacterium]